MKTVFTKEEIASYAEKDIEFASINNPVFSIIDFLNSEISLKKKTWFVYNHCNLTVEEQKELDIKLAWCVLPIFEKHYPNEKSIRECLQTIEDFKNNKITIHKLKQKRNVANAVDIHRCHVPAVSLVVRTIIYSSFWFVETSSTFAVSAASNADSDDDLSSIEADQEKSRVARVKANDARDIFVLSSNAFIHSLTASIYFKYSGDPVVAAHSSTVTRHAHMLAAANEALTSALAVFEATNTPKITYSQQIINILINFVK